MEINNLFDSLVTESDNEIFDMIVKTNNIKLERISSFGNTTSPGEWYDQDDDEWVFLVKGNANILFKKDNELVKMEAGDHILIPKRIKHRVEYTSQDALWLTLHH